MESATIKGLATRLCFWTRRVPRAIPTARCGRPVPQNSDSHDTNTKLLICSLFQKSQILAQDGGDSWGSRNPGRRSARRNQDQLAEYVASNEKFLGLGDLTQWECLGNYRTDLASFNIGNKVCKHVLVLPRAPKQSQVP